MLQTKKVGDVCCKGATTKIDKSVSKRSSVTGKRFSVTANALVKCVLLGKRFSVTVSVVRNVEAESGEVGKDTRQEQKKE